MRRKSGDSPKAKRDQLRDHMRVLGCSVAQIAAEMSRRFNLRPRVAWRHALGWPQWKLAQEYNTAHPGARLSDNRISEFESWPHGGTPPGVRYLVNLAATFGHGCTPYQLVDADDLEHICPADRCLLTPSPNGRSPASPITSGAFARSTSPMVAIPPGDRAHPDCERPHRDVDTVLIRGGGGPWSART
ncbi:MAG: hypothetical protein M3Q39_15020 [Actinomycetota bacterium]|nr:hypothetical protein [Actinomycetota bacterium]